MGVSFERNVLWMGETFFGCDRLELELQNFGILVKRNGTNLAVIDKPSNLKKKKSEKA